MKQKDSAPLIGIGWLRVALFLVVWLAIWLGIGTAILILIGKLGRPGLLEENGMLRLQVQALSSFVAAWVSVFLFRRFIDKKDVKSLGLTWKGFEKHAWTGFFAALLILCLGTLVLLLAGKLSFIGAEFSGTALFIYIIMMLLVAVAEELVVRGYMLNNLMDSFPPRLALLVSSALFSVLHLFNASANWMGLLGVFTGGLLLGINYLYTRNLWFGILFHFAWNFFQGPVLGFQVSGIEIESQLIQSADGPAWLTGGAFGFEASVLASALNLAMLAYLAIYYQKSMRLVKG